MSPEELETRLAHGEKFISHKTLDWYLKELQVAHLKDMNKLLRDDASFHRKWMIFAWLGWLITGIAAGFLQ